MPVSSKEEIYGGAVKTPRKTPAVNGCFSVIGTSARVACESDLFSLKANNWLYTEAYEPSMEKLSYKKWGKK